MGQFNINYSMRCDVEWCSDGGLTRPLWSLFPHRANCLVGSETKSEEANSLGGNVDSALFFHVVLCAVNMPACWV
jgi:hypothetical protein